MPKFTIVLQGRGSEIYQHPIDSDQREQLEHLNLQECILEDVADILNVDMEHLVSTESSIVGGIPENTEITVFDDENATIFKEEVQIILFQETHDPNSEMTEIYNSNTLYVEDNIKGQFFEITVDDEENFDVSKLKINITDIEGEDYVTSIKYKDIEGSFGDYWSKGIHFFLSNE
jgi:hypothetical protein